MKEVEQAKKIDLTHPAQEWKQACWKEYWFDGMVNPSCQAGAAKC